MDKFQLGASTMRNMFVSYRGGAYSRAGTRFVWYSKQTGRQFPPRMITFQFNVNQGLALEWGHEYMRVIEDGGYVTETPGAITNATQTQPVVITQPGHGYSTNDWIFISGVQGMVQLNGNIYTILVLDANNYQLFDIFGHPINGTLFSPYAGGGTGARIFTLATPYQEQDLAWLKWTQSADVMSICCWNQLTGTVYAPRELVRLANNNWTLNILSVGATIVPPSSGITLTINGGTGSSTNYGYTITSVSATDGSESGPSTIATASGQGDIAASFGTAELSWTAVPGVQYYNIYKATPTDGVTIPTTGPFGFAGQTTGTQFNDSNIVPDFSQTPPMGQTPFGLTDNDPNDPSVVSYFQQRRVYAGSPNSPDTYWFSKPGSYTNFDTSIPPVATDAITGTPWAVQVDGIQFFEPMPGGLVTLTGSSAWQLTGAGGSAVSPQPISPASQQAQPQAFNGIHPNVPPIKIEYDILYVQAKGSIARDLAYNYWINIYTGSDTTQLSSHLFIGYSILEWAWSEEPFKVVWAIRSDGTMISLTYLKQQQVEGWARHDTQGLFQSVCTVTEPPVDAVYVAVQRFIAPPTGFPFPIYTVERMDNRIWSQAEFCWCVDCGRELPVTNPNTTLTPSPGAGVPNGVTGLMPGTGYSPSTTVTIKDPTGSGCVVTPTISGTGGITALTFAGGSGYTNPELVINDPTAVGRGFAGQIMLNNVAIWTTDQPTFSPALVGSVIRAGGGAATILQYQSSTSVIVNVTQPVVQTVPNTNLLAPQLSATVIATNQQQVAPFPPWSISTPTSRVFGLNHLIGQTVTGLADGAVIPPQVVASDGSIELAVPASQVIVGLAFQAQLQSMYLETGNPTDQGQRKIIPAVTARIENSRGIKIGTNQPDGSVLSPPQIAPEWIGMQPAPDLGVPAYGSPIVPLYTGDVRIPVVGGVDKRGQVALQQDLPLPFQCLALVPEVVPGDSPSNSMPQRQDRQQGHP